MTVVPGLYSGFAKYKMSFAHVASPLTGTGPQSGFRTAVPRTSGRVGSEEYHSAHLPVAQEAAILYSANHPAAAAALLKAEIKDAAGRNNKQSWLMLFDVCQMTRNREEFDSLSMLFTVKFEQSPPAWADSDEAGGDPRRAQARERKDFFLLKPGATGELLPEIEKFVAFVHEHGSVRLDLGKVAAIAPDEALKLASALGGLRKKQVPMWFNHLDTFEGVLRAGVNEKATESERSYWLLLFELLILQGKAQEFEDLGLEFAIAFEMSPPNWEVYVNPVAATAPRTPAPAERAEPEARHEAGFELKGVLSAASANQIAELNGYAASRSEVVIDMAKVLRIDFAYTSVLFDVVKAIQLAGKRVIMTHLNELNAALLEALGVNRYAILVRRKST